MPRAFRFAGTTRRYGWLSAALILAFGLLDIGVPLATPLLATVCLVAPPCAHRRHR